MNSYLKFGKLLSKEEMKSVKGKSGTNCEVLCGCANGTQYLAHGSSITAAAQTCNGYCQTFQGSYMNQIISSSCS